MKVCFIYSFNSPCIYLLIWRNIITCKFALASPWCIYKERKNNTFAHFKSYLSVAFVYGGEYPIPRDLTVVA